jgi:hypothetical protein
LRRHARGFLPLGACLLSAACYEAASPLGPPGSGTLDVKVLGNWRCVAREASATAPVLLDVSSFDEHQYCVAASEEKEDSSKEASHYRAYGSTLNGATLLNVQELDRRKTAAERKWFFVRYSLLKPNVLYLEVVDDPLFKGVDGSPASVRQVIERHLDDDRLLSDLYVCTRVAEKGK